MRDADPVVRQQGEVPAAVPDAVRGQHRCVEEPAVGAVLHRAQPVSGADPGRLLPDFVQVDMGAVTAVDGHSYALVEQFRRLGGHDGDPDPEPAQPTGGGRLLQRLVLAYHGGLLHAGPRVARAEGDHAAQPQLVQSLYDAGVTGSGPTGSHTNMSLTSVTPLRSIWMPTSRVPTYASSRRRCGATGAISSRIHPSRLVLFGHVGQQRLGEVAVGVHEPGRDDVVRAAVHGVVGEPCGQLPVGAHVGDAAGC